MTASCRPAIGAGEEVVLGAELDRAARALDGIRVDTEWKSTALRAYSRRTKQADSLIAGAYLAGTNTRRVRRALSAGFGGAVSKDKMSRVWRKVKGDWEAWNARSLRGTDHPLDPGRHSSARQARPKGHVDRAARRARLREDGQKVLLAVKNMCGETSEDWRAALDDLVKRGLASQSS